MANQEKTDFNQDLHLSEIFPFPSYDEWKTEAEKLLKGAPFDKIMKSNTPEGIVLEAIYNQEDLKNISYLDNKPGEFPYLRGTSQASKIVNGWNIQQDLDVKDLTEWNKTVLNDLNKGQNSVRVKLNKDLCNRRLLSDTTKENYFSQGLPIYNYNDLKTVLNDISLKHITTDFETGCSVLPFFVLLRKYLKENSLVLSDLKGSVAGDLLKILAEEGEINCCINHLLDEVAFVTKSAIQENSSIKTILIDLSVWNNAGSSAVDDLALMASSVVFYAQSMLERGIDKDDIFDKMTFIFAVGANLFMEVSKLRAARYLFAKIAESYGVNPEKAKMRMHVKTSDYTKTVYDPWVNILRTSTEAFSAILGGCDSLNISTFDSLIKSSDEFSRRIARNQQIMLFEEAHLNAVNDPAGGSYYVEALTNQLIEKSWNYFVEIEDKGGIIEALKTGYIQDRINQSHLFRANQVDTRKDVIVGTSMYANLSEKKLTENNNYMITEQGSKGDLNQKININEDDIVKAFETCTLDVICHKLCNDKESVKIVTVPKRRIADSFENLRNASETYELKNGTKPKVVFLNVGNLVKNKPRYDFCVSFFEPAGFDCVTHDGFESLDLAIESIKDERIIVLSSTDDMYPEIVPAFAKKLKEIKPDSTLVLAGYPKDYIESFTQAGVDYYIYMKLNVVQTLTEIMKKAGVL